MICVRISPNEVYKFPLRQSQRFDSSEQEIDDCLTAWYININVRSNGIVFVKNGAAIAVGTGEQERIGLDALPEYLAERIHR